MEEVPKVCYGPWLQILYIGTTSWCVNISRKCHDHYECGSGRPGLHVGQGFPQLLANYQQQAFSLGQCRASFRKVASGFLYTYACLISSESDFLLAKEKNLLPAETESWAAWKKLVRELLARHDPDKVHPRFLRGELRLSRITKVLLFTHLHSLEPYLGSRHSYSAFVRVNLAWIGITTVFIALVLTAMQIGLAMDRLQENAAIQRASYGFTIFAIVGPLCAFALTMLLALLNLLTDLPALLEDAKGIEVHITEQV